ncbi:hypothetical protein [Bordetella genomosp. 11]|uniref:Uncharacterized protein n=1 Tax=Bordetella genomosp. 11 TaxID=1416808 RepID=A0A261UDB7_9BORD|nr:hypothetical protein [Bordetella genomosp. 11]OZI59916.1 hypothetical protein CAL28_10530 [Bordetella genomosp. 11]
MAKLRNYSYAEASSVQVGLMRCSVCNGKIRRGQFRYYATPDAYVSQHRSCCADDPKWKKLDEQAAAWRARQVALLADAQAFRAKWQISDLDELIDGLAATTKATGAAS